MLGAIIGEERMNGDRGTGRTGEVNGDKAGVMAGGEKISRLPGLCVVGPGFRMVPVTVGGGDENMVKPCLRGQWLSIPSMREENIIKATV